MNELIRRYANHDTRRETTRDASHDTRRGTPRYATHDTARDATRGATRDSKYKKIGSFTLSDNPRQADRLQKKY